MSFSLLWNLLLTLADNFSFFLNLKFINYFIFILRILNLYFSKIQKDINFQWKYLIKTSKIQCIYSIRFQKKKLQQIYIEQKSSESFSQGQSNPSKIGSIWWIFTFSNSFVNHLNDSPLFWHSRQEIESIAENDIHFLWTQRTFSLNLFSVESLKSDLSSMTQNEWCLK